MKTVAEGVKPNDLAVTRDGFILITETGAKQVTRINPQTGEVAAVDTGITKPNGIALSNDGGTLAVSDYGGTHTWTFRVNAGGMLDAKMPTMPMRLAIDPKGEFRFNEPPPYVAASRGDGMAVDKAGRYYVTSELGVQIFDPTGRPCGVLPKVDRGPAADHLHAGRQRSQHAVHCARQEDLPAKADRDETKTLACPALRGLGAAKGCKRRRPFYPGRSLPYSAPWARVIDSASRKICRHCGNRCRTADSIRSTARSTSSAGNTAPKLNVESNQDFVGTEIHRERPPRLLYRRVRLDQPLDVGRRLLVDCFAEHQTATLVENHARHGGQHQSDQDRRDSMIRGASELLSSAARRRTPPIRPASRRRFRAAP